jgi:Arm DNA-binding domain
MSIVKLTPHIIANELQCPERQSRIELCDDDRSGLYVEVRSTSPGQGTYYLRYKDATGKTCHQKIGRTTDIDLAEARKRARTLRAQIALGADPRGEAKAQREVPTLDTFFTEHYEPFAKPRKRSWKRDEELYRLRIKASSAADVSTRSPGRWCRHSTLNYSRVAWLRPRPIIS